MHKIEIELVKATRFKAKGAVGQRMRRELVRAARKLTDDRWDLLSTAAQKWVNSGIDALADSAAVPKFPTDSADEEEFYEPAKVEEAKVTKRPVRAPATASTCIKMLILRNPKVTVEELIEKLEHHGYTPTRFFVATTRSNFRSGLKVIKSEYQKKADQERFWGSLKDI